MSNNDESKLPNSDVHVDLLDVTVKIDKLQNSKQDCKLNNYINSLDEISSLNIKNTDAKDILDDNDKDTLDDSDKDTLDTDKDTLDDNNNNLPDDNNDNLPDNNNNNHETSIDFLFALRTYYQDYYDDETEIIQMLKTNLTDQHYSESQANTLLREFYTSFGINIDLTIFEEIQSLPSDQEILTQFINSIPINNSIVNIINNITNDVTDDANNQPSNGVIVSQLINALANLPNQNDHSIMNIFTSILAGPPPVEDVLCTLDEEEKEKLKKFILETKIDEKCNICLDEMIESQEVVVLPCDHTYHSGCILKYLDEYNYKCPICRKEVGKPKYNL